MRNNKVDLVLLRLRLHFDKILPLAPNNELASY